MRIAIIVVLGIALNTGCWRETPDPDMAAATATTDTAANLTANPSTVSPATTAVTGGSVSAMQPSDKEFVIQAAYTSATEVAQSLIAAGRARNAEVKTFAQRMVREHGKSNEELQKLATLTGLALPTGLDAERQQAVDRLQSASDAAFDGIYVANMVNDHRKAVAMFENAQRTVQNADVRAWVAATLPVLREHLTHAQRLSAAVR